ncbi:L-type lectin-domain containing receptor kinase S.4 isoform X1 [Selaginella moellendorffii]|uniref:L-type lectin-domain containing receptor kinase S.4 isoform X1 n=2 Tax=Selaginella moellendorffii TaxID=88036 RepID=UPI000D1CFF9C|nr:L-type lectin-domain containing receptor kinase S.4 isoform X1 [Selaginella moellendorffii]|eukprot:XP_024531089.1 L-type lectin-domain containing receptor kinase S.4 isoform X1 [Selaginella moellendorffii]
MQARQGQDRAGASIQLPALGPESMVFMGNASFGRTGQIELNSPMLGSAAATTPTLSSGRALFNLPLQMLNPSASFETSFTFSTIQGSSFFFVIVPNNQELATLHGLSVRFTTANNTIAVWSSSRNLATTVAEFDLGLESRRTFVWISYDSRRHRVEIRASNFSVLAAPPLPVIALGLDLSARVVNQFMYVGFSASSTLLAAKSTICAWNFTSWVPDPSVHPDPATLDSAALDSSSKSSSARLRKNLAAAGIAVTALVVFVVAAVVVVRIMRNSASHHARKKFSRTTDRKLDPEVGDDQSMAKFSYKQLVSATNAFDLRHKLGPPATSQCYRGVLSDSIVAIKVVSDSNSLVEESLKLVLELASLRHRNLVNLLGWCSNKTTAEQRSSFLVYEFIPNGSLDEHLFSSSTKSNPLPWSHRHKVACGVAQALDHLHSRGLAHGNVKSSNVMLDANFTARLGDYSLKNRGTGKAGGAEQPLAGSMIVAGTFGYVAPEAVQTGRPTSRADVFAFGAVVLELVCGRRALETSSSGEIGDEQRSKVGEDRAADGGDQNSSSGATVLVDRVREVLSSNSHGSDFKKSIELEKVVDVKLAGLYDVSEMEVLVSLGLACSDLDPERRPAMETVVKMLAGEIPVPSPRLLLSSSPSPSSIESKDRSSKKDRKMKGAAEQQRRPIEELLAMKDFGSLFAADNDSAV